MSSGFCALHIFLLWYLLNFKPRARDVVSGRVLAYYAEDPGSNLYSARKKKPHKNKQIRISGLLFVSHVFFLIPEIA